ncbi:MAG: lysine biosynthesis protein LysW [Gemmatimonadetes bacterium]|nr:lysine biosynthesis protein LysW [Gemmatimonadota bacterium]
MSGATEIAGVSCPECAAALPIQGTPIPNEIIPCPDCGVELEVVSVEPLAVELAPPVQEDWGE